MTIINNNQVVYGSVKCNVSS